MSGNFEGITDTPAPANQHPVPRQENARTIIDLIQIEKLTGWLLDNTNK